MRPPAPMLYWFATAPVMGRQALEPCLNRLTRRPVLDKRNIIVAMTRHAV